MLRLTDSRFAKFAYDPIECGLRIFGIFGKISKLIIDGIAVPDYRINITLGKLANGMIKFNCFSIVHINRRCVLRITTE